MATIVLQDRIANRPVVKAIRLEEWVTRHPEDLDGRIWLFKKLWTNLPHYLRRRLFWWVVRDFIHHF